MTQSQLAVGYRELIHNGRELKTDGYRRHLGGMDSGGLRVQRDISPLNGVGLELGYYAPSTYGYLQAYDRDTNSLLDLRLNARNITFQGNVALPAGTSQALLGKYRQLAAYNVPAAGAWTETPVQLTVTTLAGSTLRLEAGGCVTGATLNAVIYLGFGIDGVVTGAADVGGDSQFVTQIPVAGGTAGYSMIWYKTGLSAGVHRFSTFVYVNSGAGGLSAAGYQSLYVTEQRA